jgi:hypothetical protein
MQLGSSSLYHRAGQVECPDVSEGLAALIFSFLMLSPWNGVYFSDSTKQATWQGTPAGRIVPKTSDWGKGEPMKSYENAGGYSAVVAFENGDGSIKVKFVDGSVCPYTYGNIGGINVEHMKKYADIGHGLNGFITRFVGKESRTSLKQHA